MCIDTFTKNVMLVAAEKYDFDYRDESVLLAVYFREIRTIRILMEGLKSLIKHSNAALRCLTDSLDTLFEDLRPGITEKKYHFYNDVNQYEKDSLENPHYQNSVTGIKISE